MEELLHKLAKATSDEDQANSLRAVAHAIMGPDEKRDQARINQVFEHPTAAVPRIIDLLASANDNTVAHNAAWLLTMLTREEINADRMVREYPGCASAIVSRLPQAASEFPPLEQLLWTSMECLTTGVETLPLLAAAHPELVPMAIDVVGRQDLAGTPAFMVGDARSVANRLTFTAAAASAMVASERSALLLSGLVRELKREKREHAQLLAVRSCFYLALPPRTRHVLRDNQALMDQLTLMVNEEYRTSKRDLSFTAVMTLALLYGESAAASDVNNGGNDTAATAVLKSTEYMLERAVKVALPSTPGALTGKLQLALRYLVVVDHNRQVLWQKCGADMLERTVGALDLAIAQKDAERADSLVCILSQFSSDAEPLAWMRGNREAYAPALVELNQHKHEFEAAHRAAQFWMLSVDPPTVVSSSSSSNSGAASRSSSAAATTVMISYNWQFQQEARAIHSILESLGLKVWRDEQDMRESINDSMADAVSKCDVVLVLVSRSYKESANCKKECEFAERNKRKLVPVLVDPGYHTFVTDGWLGIMLGGRLYYDVSASSNGKPPALEQVIRALVEKELAVVAVESPAGMVKRQASSAVPHNECEMRDWLVSKSAADGQAIADKLVKEGFASGSDDLVMLAKRTAPELKTLVDLTGKQAVVLETALRELFGQ